MRLATVPLFVFCCLFTSSALAQRAPDANKAGDEIHILIEAAKPYDKLVSKIEQLGGVVRYAYSHIDALAVTVPSDRLNEVSGFKEAGTIVEDRVITHEEPRTFERAGFGTVTSRYDLSTSDIVGEVTDFLSVAPAGYFPTEVDLTGALEFWTETGHFGEGVIIGILDSGLGPVSALSGRIVGGENFLSGTPLDDGIPAISPLNAPHGTWVATTAGANVGFCFFATSALAQSIQTHLPAASIPDGCGPGIDLIPMVGQAPLAEFFALKVFNNMDMTSNSALLAGFDRAIELKELYDAGAGGVNIQVLNGSLGGATLFAGDDPFFAGMIERVTAAGIVTVFSAGNEGPGGMTGGDPGTARHTLTVGATNFAPYERILRDLQFGLGFGALFRPSDAHQTADFSSRGPTADGRTDPDLTAPGVALFVQGASGGLNLVDGTSFSAPNVAGAAALLLSAVPGATPSQIRGALLAGADPNVLEDNSGPFDQGFGFVDVKGAYDHFSTPSPPDQGQENVNVKTNVQKLGVDVISSRHASRSTGWLLPGERAEFFVDTKATDAGMTVQVSVTAELPPGQQNQLFGDDALVAIHSAKTSSIGATGDYRAGTPAFVPGAATFFLGPSDLNEGLTRISVTGTWTNAGRIRASVQIITDKAGLAKSKPINGKVAADEFKIHTLNVAPGTTELILTLDWASDWSQWPTNDLDLFAFDPDGNLILLDGDGDGDFDGLSLDAPERVVIADPAAGPWTLAVDGFTVWSGREKYQIIAHTTSAAGKQTIAAADELAGDYALSDAYPNPFNPHTQFTLHVKQAQQVRIEVFDLLGKQVALLHDGVVSANEQHTFRFEASDLPSGMYLYRVAGESFTDTRRIMLVK